MPFVFVLQHAACEPLGMIESALTQGGLSLHCFHAQNGDPVPQEIGAAAGLVVLGGSMGVHDQQQYPFLGKELDLIKQALEPVMHFEVDFRHERKFLPKSLPQRCF